MWVVRPCGARFSASIALDASTLRRATTLAAIPDADGYFAFDAGHIYSLRTGTLRPLAERKHKGF
jgi:hypothetical protein